MTAVRDDRVTPEPAAAPAPRRLPPRRKNISPVLIVRQSVGTSLIILAVSALGYAVWLGIFSRLHYDKAQLNAYETLRVELANGTAPNGPLVYPKAQLGSSGTNSIFNPGGTSSTPTTPPAPTLLPGGSPLAVLSIPAIGLRTVILEGTSGAVLENGPGHLRDTPMPGQAGISVILGRRAGYGGPFGKLGSLQPGDDVTVVTGQAVCAFKVVDVRRAGDPMPQPPATGASRMILTTADGAPLVPSGILYVDADLMSKVQPGPQTLLGSSYVSGPEDAMATDSQAWLPIMLWAALLLIVTTVLSWLWIAWGRWQTWLIAVPIVGYIMVSAADEVTRLLPNLL
jgi:LPXTG-site transpeptidase (sortase) family protein